MRSLVDRPSRRVIKELSDEIYELAFVKQLNFIHEEMAGKTIMWEGLGVYNRIFIIPDTNVLNKQDYNQTVS